MADASHFPIVEYRIRPHRHDGIVEWYGKRSFDLRHIDSAESYNNFTAITRCGESLVEVIDAEYTDFMRDWCRAKGL